MPQAMHQYGSALGRLERFSGSILKNAQPDEFFGKVGRQVLYPANASKTYVARRYLPYGATATNFNTINRYIQDGTGDRAAAVVAAHQTTDGVTAPAENIVPVDTVANIVQLNCLYGFTDQTFDLYEDDIPKEMKAQVGQRTSFVNEMFHYGQLKACQNQYFGGTGTTIGTVNGKLTLDLLRRISMNLIKNKANYVRTALKAGVEFATAPIEAAYLVYIPPDLESDVRDLAKFVSSVAYASGKALPGEIGSCERFRFFVHRDLPALQSAGATGSGFYSTNGTNADVYQIIVMGENAYSHIAVRGKNVLRGTFLSPKEIDKSDPNGQRGYAGAIWYMGAMVENSGWMAVANVARTNA